jgi:hypothetical protein
MFTRPGAPHEEFQVTSTIGRQRGDFTKKGIDRWIPKKESLFPLQSVIIQVVCRGTISCETHLAGQRIFLPRTLWNGHRPGGRGLVIGAVQ